MVCWGRQLTPHTFAPPRARMSVGPADRLHVSKPGRLSLGPGNRLDFLHLSRSGRSPGLREHATSPCSTQHERSPLPHPSAHRHTRAWWERAPSTQLLACRRRVAGRLPPAALTGQWFGGVARRATLTGVRPHIVAGPSAREGIVSVGTSGGAVEPWSAAARGGSACRHDSSSRQMSSIGKAASSPRGPLRRLAVEFH